MAAADDSKSELILEFEEFQHKLHAAIRVTHFAYQDEMEGILRIARFPYAYKGQTAERPANTDEIMWVKDADDPQRWKPIKGRKIAQRGSPNSRAQAAARTKTRAENQHLMIGLGLQYYLDVVLARMIPHVRQNFKDVAALARRYSSSDLLLQQAQLAPFEILASGNKNQDGLELLCEFWSRPESAASFRERFSVMFVKEFEQLRSEIELESRPEPKVIESEAVPASVQSAELEPAAAPNPPVDPPESKILETRIQAEKIAETTTAATPISRPLSKRLQRGKDCEEMAMEIRKIRSDVRDHGMTIFESREAHPGFRIWNFVEHLPDEDKKIFNKPDEWGPVIGYANTLLARHYGVKPSVVDESRKEWRAHEQSAIPKTSS
jgi:hypothetical protein